MPASNLCKRSAPRTTSRWAACFARLTFITGNAIFLRLSSGAVLLFAAVYARLGSPCPNFRTYCLRRRR
jgi:hypothetical protein